jgi:hypothetical protein
MEKRKVTMTSVVALPGGNIATHKAEDYVALEHLDAYMAHARTNGWQLVEAGDEHDPGPGGEDGAYTVHPHMIGE